MVLMMVSRKQPDMYHEVSVVTSAGALLLLREHVQVQREVEIDMST